MVANNFSRVPTILVSKTPDETLQIWDKEQVISDVIWAIRKFQPDVIINRFDHRSPGTTHGHHTASAMLSLEAFDKANDPNTVFPNQFTSVTTWQPKRIFSILLGGFTEAKKNLKKLTKPI
jgi:LmbE family N-acetylglucosaminyl deacetylase